ncbi:MAG: serine/threonine protein kinase [Porticoccaceae bacterium]
MIEQDPQHPFERLTPDLIIDAVQSTGLWCDGRLLPLNSYENRVYQVGLDEGSPVIVKFYRPERWSDEQILEEHQFCFELAEQELPIVAPLLIPGDDRQTSLAHFGGFRFAIYPRRGGHAPELDNLDNLHTLGKCIGRIHQVGRARPFVHRLAIDVQSFGHESVDYIATHMIPADLKAVYVGVAHDLLAAVEDAFSTLRGDDYIRVHGDCHPGNILWRDDLPHFVDFDDARMAPAIQDIWMLLSGERQRQTAQLCEILDAYAEFCDFDPRQLRWAEGFRALRLMYFAAWLARRWQDPAFPRVFTWFNTARYWGDHILELREQLATIAEPPLQWL